MQASKVYSAIDAKAVKPLMMAMDDVSAFADLSRIGIGISRQQVREMMQYMGYGMDTIQQGITVPNIPASVQFLQAFLPGLVHTITAARKIDEITGVITAGSWEDEQVIQGVLENTGSAVPYGDYTNVPLASWNMVWNTRQIVRFEEGMRVGNLEEARAARVNVNSAQAKRESCANALDIQRNAVGFFGYNAGNNNTYGFLNDPNLPGYITVAAGASTSTLWSTKTYLEITADIRNAIIQLRTQTQDTIDPKKTPMTLVLPTASVDFLSVVSQFGNSVQEWLDEAYPAVRVVSAPQLNAANGGANVFYLFADNMGDTSTDDGKAFAQIVPARFQLLGVQKMVKGYEEDYTNATAGIFLKRPYAVVRYTGI